MFYFWCYLFILTVTAAPKGPNQKTLSRPSGGRIINGEPAALGQFPWQAALRVIDQDMSRWFCGGSIINEEWILTAGHCADGAETAQILTGLIQLNESSTESSSSEFIVHEGFNFTTLENDIALLKLDKPLVFDNYTQPITLSSEVLEDGVKITVSGWGKTTELGPVSEILNYVDLVTITKNQCEDVYGKGEILDGMICGTSENDVVRSTCNGDSGGPVVINLDTDPVHVAIVSFVSDSGCESGDPSGYTRTDFYRKWIQEKTGV